MRLLILSLLTLLTLGLVSCSSKRVVLPPPAVIAPVRPAPPQAPVVSAREVSEAVRMVRGSLQVAQAQAAEQARQTDAARVESKALAEQLSAASVRGEASRDELADFRDLAENLEMILQQARGQIARGVAALVEVSEEVEVLEVEVEELGIGLAASEQETLTLRGSLEEANGVIIGLTAEGQALFGDSVKHARAAEDWEAAAGAEAVRRAGWQWRFWILVLANVAAVGAWIWFKSGVGRFF